MRFKFWIVLFLFSTKLNGQIVLSTELKIGIDKIGLLYDWSGGTTFFKKHRVNLGFRLYEPDNLFERNIPGIILMYQYQLFNTSNRFNAEIGYLFNFTNREMLNHDVTLFDHKIYLEPTFKINNHWNVFMQFGLGYDFIRPTVNPNSNEVFTFVNYEANLGVRYTFSRSTAGK